MKKILPLAILTLLQGTGLGIIIPIMTHYVLLFGGSEQNAPLIFSIFSLMAFISAMFWGRMSDKVGRRAVLLFSAFGIAFSYAWLTVASQLWELYAARALAGLASGWTVAAFAYVTDVTSEKDRAKGMGMLGAFFGMGFIFGPAIGAFLLMANNYSILTFVSFFCSVVSAFGVIIFISEPKKIVPTKKITLLKLLKVQQVRPLLIIAFITSLCFTAVEGSIAVYLYMKYSVTATTIAWVMVVAGLVNIFTQGFLLNVCIKIIKETGTLFAGILLLIAGLVFMVFIDTVGIYMPMVLLSLGFGLAMPTLNTIASKIAPVSIKGGMSGAIQSMQSLARVFGPALAGWGLVNMSYSPYAVAGAVLIIPIILIAFLRTRADAK